MKRFASTRSEKRASQPCAGLAQCSVGSIDEDGIRYGLTTHALIASTIAIAPTMVTIQSIVTRRPCGRPCVRRSTGLRERCRGRRFRLRLATEGGPQAGSSVRSYSARLNGSARVWYAALSSRTRSSLHAMSRSRVSASSISDRAPHDRRRGSRSGRSPGAPFAALLAPPLVDPRRGRRRGGRRERASRGTRRAACSADTRARLRARPRSSRARPSPRRARRAGAARSRRASTIAGSSPPERTYGPIEIASEQRWVTIRSSKPSKREESSVSRSSAAAPRRPPGRAAGPAGVSAITRCSGASP